LGGTFFIGLGEDKDSSLGEMVVLLGSDVEEVEAADGTEEVA